MGVGSPRCPTAPPLSSRVAPTSRRTVRRHHSDSGAGPGPLTTPTRQRRLTSQWPHTAETMGKRGPRPRRPLCATPRQQPSAMKASVPRLRSRIMRKVSGMVMAFSEGGGPAAWAGQGVWAESWQALPRCTQENITGLEFICALLLGKICLSSMSLQQVFFVVPIEHADFTDLRCSAQAFAETQNHETNLQKALSAQAAVRGSNPSPFSEAHRIKMQRKKREKKYKIKISFDHNLF